LFIRGKCSQESQGFPYVFLDKLFATDKECFFVMPLAGRGGKKWGTGFIFLTGVQQTTD